MITEKKRVVLRIADTSLGKLFSRLLCLDRIKEGAGFQFTTTNSPRNMKNIRQHPLHERKRAGRASGSGYGVAQPNAGCGPYKKSGAARSRSSLAVRQLTPLPSNRHRSDSRPRFFSVRSLGSHRSARRIIFSSSVRVECVGPRPRYCAPGKQKTG